MNNQSVDATRILSDCPQDCRRCPYCRIYTGEGERGIYYAFGCDMLPDDLHTPIADSMAELHEAAEDLLRAEAMA